MSEARLKSKNNLPDGFRNKAAVVSGVLDKTSLEPGIYLRRENGDIKSAKYSDLMRYENMKNIYVDYKKDRVLTDKFDDSLKWPEIDFVYDAQLEAVFADRGRYVLKFIHDVQDRGDLDLYFYFRAQGSEYKITGSIERLLSLIHI